MNPRHADYGSAPRYRLLVSRGSAPGSLATWPMGLFASADYLERHGEPVPGTGFERLDLVFYLPHLQARRQLTLVGEPVHAGRIVSGLNSSLMLRAAVRSGLGLGELPMPIAERDGLVRIWPERTSAMIDCIVQAFEMTPAGHPARR